MCKLYCIRDVFSVAFLGMLSFLFLLKNILYSLPVIKWKIVTVGNGNEWCQAGGGYYCLNYMRSTIHPLISQRGSKKGRTPPLYLEGLKVTHLGLSSIYLYNCRKLLHFRQREKRVVNAKKRGLRPEFSGGSPAVTDFAAVCCLDIHGKTVFRISLSKARKSAWILKKMEWHLFCHSIMVPVVGLEPTRYRYQWILSPSRLPIPSHRHVILELNKVYYMA